MTDLQVKFWDALERQRANRAAEEELRKSHRESERQNLIDLQERERHNRATEEINQLMAYASQLQASAAARQARVAEYRAKLEAQRVALEETITSANAAKLRAETILTESKNITERYNQMYSEAKIEESRANTNLANARITSETYSQQESASRTELNQQRAKTEAITRSSQLVNTISSWATLPATIVEGYGDAGRSALGAVNMFKTIKKGS